MRLLTDTEFKVILDRYNRPWAGYRKVRKGPMKRISKQMELLGCGSVEDYLARLAADPVEEELLFFYLRITISRFFRDRRLWASLVERVFPYLLQKSDSLKIWSAGCSCGEEAYSLCILHHRYFAYSCAITILATDANTTCLDRARKGLYQKSSLRELDSATLTTYFSPAGRKNEYLIKPMFKERITWKKHDFFTAPPDSGFDILLLRNNLLTYHTPPMQAKALSRMLQSLKPGGFLLTGSHERVPETPFTLVPSEYCSMIYQLKR